MLRSFTDERFDIIIQAGQSNAEGSGVGDAKDPYVPNERVFYLDSDFTVSQACERVAGNAIQTNFSLSFAREYVKAGMLDGDRKLLILRCAVGGTGFSDLRWGMKDDLYTRMMEMIRSALELNPENRLVALLWHQGETDAINNASYETHYENLTRLLASVRGTFHAPELPFVAGDFVLHWKGRHMDICEPVVDAIRAVCGDCVRCGFVTSEGLLSNDQAGSKKNDIIHFCRESLYELGIRYFNCFCGIAEESV